MGRPRRGGPVEAGTNHAQSGGEVCFWQKEYLANRPKWSSLKSLRQDRTGRVGERAKAAWLTCGVVRHSEFICSATVSH